MALTKIGTDGVKDDAVTTDKLANAINTERTANTAKVSTTINNNADNRVITGSGTANTLNGESTVVVDANGNLGIGTTSPSGKLNLATGASAACELRLTSNNTGSGSGDRGRLSVYSSRNDGTAFEAGKIEIDRESGTEDKARIQLFTNGGSGNTERMRIDSAGNVDISSGYLSLPDESSGSQFRLGAGNDFQIEHDGTNSYIYNLTNDLLIQCDDSVKITAKTGGTQRFRFDSDGLKFGSDTAAANALDDYEEGTYTPSFLFGGSDTCTYGSRSGYYTKVGNLVFAKWAVDLTARGGSGSGAFSVGGLPFTIANKLTSTGQEVGGAVSYWFNTMAWNWVSYWGNDGNTFLQVQYTTGDGNTSVQQFANRGNLNDNTGMRGWVIYQA